jgi:hypothetical protein
VNRIEAICRDESIDADFQRLDGYLFAPADKPQSELDEEYEPAAGSASTSNGPIARPCPASTPAARCASPTRAGSTRPNICAGSLWRSRRAAGALLRHGPCRRRGKGTAGSRSRPRPGPVIRASAAVFATNSPTNDKVAIHTKQLPDRTYVVAGRVPKGIVADALVWDTYDAIIMSASSRSSEPRTC